MKNLDLKKIFSHKNKKTSHSFVIMRPNHDWKVIIYTFVSLLIGFFIFSFYFLDRIRKDDLFNVERLDGGRSMLINQVLLEKTLNEFNTKSQKINTFPQKEYFVIDPSK